MAEKILIVDDDLDTLRLVGLLLQRKGYQITAANHGGQALDKVRAEQPDLILLDVMMPDMDGFEVVRRLRADANTSSIPIIMFTAKTQVDDKVTGFEAGADDYLTKPTHPAELLARVKAILARSARKRALSIPAPKQEKGRVIGVLAAKGGLGVTTVALNLGMTFQKATRATVTVADFRPGNGSLSLMMGYPLQESFNALLEKAPEEITLQNIQNAMVHHKSGINLLMSSYQPTGAQHVCAAAQFKTVASHLAQLSKYIVLDLGPGLPPITEQVLELCEQLIVVVEPTMNSVVQTKALLDDLSLKVLGLGRINLIMMTLHRSDLHLSRNQVQDKLGHTIAVTFSPVPELAFQAMRQNIPLVMVQADSLGAQQFNKLAEITLKHGQKIRA